MPEALTGETARRELVDVIRQVRRRWRTKLLLGGAITVLGGGLIALGLAAWGLQIARFSPASVVGLRVAVFAVFAALVAIWFIRPLRQRVSDVQVALYIEEHEPSLQAAILSAVDAGATSAGVTPEGVPAVIIERMIDQAVEKTRASESVRTVGRSAVRRNSVVLGTLTAVIALLLSVGPEFFRQGASALLVLSRDAEAASPYAIRVEPGDITIPKGADQTVKARLSGFRSADVAMLVKAEGAAEFERMPLLSGANAESYEGMLFDVKTPLEYYIEADGVRSPVYAMKVVELPAVETSSSSTCFPRIPALRRRRSSLVATLRRFGEPRCGFA